MPSGADVLPPIPARVIRQLATFSELGAQDQTAFLDALNVYLYSSPQQRRRLRALWAQAPALLGEGTGAPASGDAP